MDFFREKKQYSPVNNFEELMTEDYIFVLDSGSERDSETSIKEFGEENIIIASDLNIPKLQSRDKAFVKISVFGENHSLNEHSKVKGIIYKKDLVKFDANDLSRLAKNLQYLWGSDALNRTTPQNVREIYFVDCKFSDLNTRMFSDEIIRNKLFFIDCYIQNLLAENVAYFHFSEKFLNCTFDNLFQKTSGNKIHFSNCIINNLVTTGKEVDLNDIKLKLFFHKRIDSAEINSSNAKIIFDRKLIKQIDKDQYRGYLNTFNHLVNVRSFNSERTEIEKYIAYFESRDDSIKKILFWFHRGYTKILIPLLASIFFLLLNFSITYYDIGYTAPDALSTVFYPVDLFRKVIFYGFSFYNSFSFWKLLLFFSELLFVYSLFCLGFAVKKRYGFKIIK